MSEIIVPLSAEQWGVIQNAEAQKAQIEREKSAAVTFMLLGVAARDRIEAAIAAGVLEIRELESGVRALVIPDMVDKTE